MKGLLKQGIIRLAEAGFLPTDGEEERLQKAVLIFMVSLYIILGALWGIAYTALGLKWCAVIPFGYSVISIFSLIFFFCSKQYHSFRFCQLTLILFVPFMLQWSLGGFAASSAVMIWAILSPIGALMFAGTREAIPWFFAYLLLMGLSGAFDGMLSENAIVLPQWVRVTFFVLNILGVTSIAFVLIRYFVKERELAMAALGKEHEMVQRDRERLLKIKSVLGHFVPETAKKIIERDPDRAVLDKYIQDATVLFLDIEGFTSFLQEYPVERINQAIETYFSLFYDLIQKRGGDINETAGDGMMVIFLDQDPKKHAINAVRAALDIQGQCIDYKRTGDPNLFPISVNIGISSGKVYLGSTKMRGTEGDRWTFTASGPVTLLAARLSEFGRGGQILIGEETARRVGESIPVSSLGKVELKNMLDPGEVFEVTDPPRKSN